MIQKNLWRFALCSAITMITSPAVAQRGGFGPEGFFDRLDRDGNGVIEDHEVDDPRTRGFVERTGLDLSRGISRDDFDDSMARMRQRFQEGGGFGGRSRGGWGDRSDGGDQEGDEESRRWSRGGWSRDRGGDEGDDSEGDRSSRRRRRGRDDERNESGDRLRVTAEATPQSRVTIDLQSDFVAGDADHDGQIGLYEWTNWKSRAALGQFLGLDRDGDGFLTPRELSHAAEATPVDVASFYPVSPVLKTPDEKGTGNPSSSAPVSTTLVTGDPSLSSTSQFPATTKPSGAAPLSPETDHPKVKQALYDFSLLDRNRDGNISEGEWNISRKLKPRFEQAGANLTQPMTSEQFVGYYIRIYGDDTSI